LHREEPNKGGVVLRSLKKLSLTSWIFIALLVGIVLGVLFAHFAQSLSTFFFA
jgi:hypothetical protein